METNKDLKRLVSVYMVAPILVQRAVFIAVLSFLFFMAMMLAFYLRQSLGYFLLATAFLFVYLITMFGWFTMRKRVVRIFEKGFEFKNTRYSWEEIGGISDSLPVVVNLKSGKSLQLPASINDLDVLARQIRSQIT